ncbi:MAG TPA: outer membrane beta-barrel protein [Candidatus Polarisedimenticolia bacterium]|jgi:hypothetical protein
MTRRLAGPAAVLALLMAPSLHPLAALRDRAAEVGPYVTGAFFDGDSNIENTAGLGVRVGYFFLKDHAMEFSLDHVLTNDEFDDDLDVNLTSFKVGYLYSFLPGAVVTPHLMIGAGAQRLAVSRTSCRDIWWWEDCDTVTYVREIDPLAYAGVGFRVFMGRSFSLRLDGQAVAVFPDEGDENALVDGILNLGVSWIVGGRPQVPVIVEDR